MQNSNIRYKKFNIIKNSKIFKNTINKKNNVSSTFKIFHKKKTKRIMQSYKQENYLYEKSNATKFFSNPNMFPNVF